MAGIVALRPPPTRRIARVADRPDGAAFAEAAALATVRPLRTGRPSAEPGQAPSGQTRLEEARSGQARLAEIRAAGLVRRASEQTEPGAVERFLPIVPELRPLFPGGSLRRGSTVAVGRDGTTPGSTSLLFTLLAAASAAGSWCAAVGLPHLGLVAAAEAGVAVDRFALVPNPGPEWSSVVAALLDGVDIVVVATPGPVAATVASRLAARARQRGVVLVPMGRWAGADLNLEVVDGAWHGLGQGQGRLRRHELEVLAYGRGAAARVRRARLWLPGSFDAGSMAVGGSVATGSAVDTTVTVHPAWAGRAGAEAVPLEMAG